MRALSVGIIGFGRIGALHGEWLRAAGLEVAGVADATEGRRALAESRGLRAVDSAQGLLDDPSVDAVLIALPTSLHFDQAAAALAAGKHVMVEKPMTLDLSSAHRLVEQAEAGRRVLSVFHNRRWDVDYLTVMGLVKSGRLGRVINVESRLGQWASCVGPAAREWRPGWRTEAAWGGGGLYDWGSHFIDQLWRLMLPARPRRVFAQLRGNVWSRDCDDLARVCIDFDDGAVGLVEINTTTTLPGPRWKLDGTAGSAQSPLGTGFDTHQWARLAFAAADGSAPRAITEAAGGLDEPEIWRQFAEAVRGEGSPAVTPRSVLPTMALLDAARESSRRGAAVDLDDGMDWGDR